MTSGRERSIEGHVVLPAVSRWGRHLASVHSGHMGKLEGPKTPVTRPLSFWSRVGTQAMPVDPVREGHKPRSESGV